MRWYLISFFLMPFVGDAQLKMPKFFSDNMVLQRDEPIHIWGSSYPGKTVKVSFSRNTKSTSVNKDSSWALYLEKQEANSKPQTLTVSCGAESIVYKNILLGDVWIASGQSNMEWPMMKEMHWNEEKKNADQPLIRFVNPTPAGRNVYGVTYSDSLNRRLNQNDFYLWESWESADSNSLSDMSAVAWYFARSIVDNENIPIGLINLSIGGAPLETFVSREMMKQSRKFAPKVEGNWLFNENLPEWVRQRGRENVGSNVNGYRDELGLNHAYKPGFAFEAGVKPLSALAVKGVIWYQGESNSLEKERVVEYRELLHLLIDDYRDQWKKPAMPFYWVQLSSIDTGNYKSELWPEFRDEQRKLLEDVHGGGMAVSSDIGFRNNVHPTNKKAVGERLARWALQQVYKKEIIPSGPLPLKAEYKKGTVIISFRYASGLTTSDKKPLRGFSFDDQTEVTAVIRKEKVIIKTDQKPRWVYYGWKPYSDGNLVNSENLPASTFKLNIE